MNTKSNGSKDIIAFLLAIIYALGIISLVLSVLVYFIFPNYFTIKSSLFMLILSIVAYCSVLEIIRELIKINDTLIIDKMPFVKANVERMQRISICLFIISVYVFIKDWLKFKSHFLAFDFDNTGLVTDSEFIIFVLLGLLVLVLANIFKNAIEIKNENDLTI